MEFSRIINDKKTAGKAAWLVYTLCTVIMGAMSYFSGWSIWVIMELGLHLLVLTFLTFYPKSSARIQSIFMMIFSFANIFMCSVAEGNIYPSMLVFLGAAMLLLVYRSVKLLLTYLALIAGGILFHIFALNTIQFDTSLHITEFIVRVSVLFVAQFFLIILVRGLNRSEELMLKSVEEARRAEHYKSDFLANMSHEIRTPMNAIIGMCELILRENDLSDSARENCFNIHTSGKSLLSIINDILDFSKIESGKMELINEEFNIASVLNDIINMSEARKGKKKIEILVNADPDIPRGLVGDEVRIRQVIINLMTNAIKFTERGRVTLTLSSTKQEYGINLFVSVADTGIGITEENIEKLFSSFRQVDTKKNRSVEGTGLGLAISKRLIGQMGGFISVRSEYGTGTEFRFTIPLHVADARSFATVKGSDTIHAAAYFGEDEFAAVQGQVFCETGHRLGVDFRHVKSMDELKELIEGTVTHIFVRREDYLEDRDYFVKIAENVKVFVIQDRMDALTLPDGIKCIFKPFYLIPAVSALNNESMVLSLNERRGADIRFTAPKARILIVDDNAMNLKVAMGLMQPYNMQLVTAVSGPEAIEILRAKDMDMVFMDHMMPEMDGVEATEIIRDMKDEYYKKLPVIALTANAVNGAREKYVTSGFNDFLAKPIELTALDRILKNYLPKEYMQPPKKGSYEKWDRRRSDKSEENHSPLLNINKGLSYMGGNEDGYREILSIFAKASEEKIRQIKELYEQNNLKNYAIEVHALKSNSLNIGAEKLSELAKELESAGKAGEVNIVEEKTDELLKLYGDVAEVVRQYLGDTDDTASQQEGSEDVELSEVSADELIEYIERAKTACQDFDDDTVANMVTEIAGYSFGGEPLKAYFMKAAQLAGDFEYEDAEQELIKLEEKVKNMS